MASSISHDLRHSLAAVVANAEFLCESNLTPRQREDLYAEIRIAVNQMTICLSRCWNFRARESPCVRAMATCARRSIAPCRGSRRIPNSNPYGFTFPRKARRRLVRFQKAGARVADLLLNACEAVRRKPEDRDWVAPSGRKSEIRIEDNGPGIADAVRDHLFEPFVSHGKENGTGMGLTVVQKILQITARRYVEQTSVKGTTFCVKIPLNPATENSLAVRHTG